MFYTCTYRSPIGPLTLSSDGAALTGLWMVGQKYYAATLRGETREDAGEPTLLLASQWLDAYFAGEQPLISRLPLAPAGSIFRQRVWALLRSIPYGETVSYGQLARALAQELGLEQMSAQAVGGAVGHNPISVIIPCHRVTGSNGSLTGYAGGLEKKLWLLRHEGADTGSLFLPRRGTAL